MARLTVLITAGMLAVTGAAAQVATSSSTTLPSGASAAGTGTSTDATVQGRGAAGLPGTPSGTGTTASNTGSGTVVTDTGAGEPATRVSPSTRIELGGPPSSASPSGARGSVVPGPFEPSLIGGRAGCPPDMRKRDGVCIPTRSQ